MRTGAKKMSSGVIVLMALKGRKPVSYRGTGKRDLKLTI
jgi:hypothetical protein